MEGDVRRGAISPTADLFFLLVQYGFEFLHISRCCSRCGERGHPRIEEHARFEDILESELRHRLSQALSIALGNKSARTRTADDERLKLHDSQGFANRRPADLHSFRQFALGWKLIAWLEFSPAYIGGQLHHDLFMQRPSLYFSQGLRHAISNSAANGCGPVARPMRSSGQTRLMDFIDTAYWICQGKIWKNLASGRTASRRSAEFIPPARSEVRGSGINSALRPPQCWIYLTPSDWTRSQEPFTVPLQLHENKNANEPMVSRCGYSQCLRGRWPVDCGRDGRHRQGPQTAK